MKRDPKEKEFEDYVSCVKIKKIHPRFFYTRCAHCENEFKNEDMYKCNYESKTMKTYMTYYGCTECFNSIEDFKEHMHYIGILPYTYEEYWYWKGNLRI